MIITGKYPTLRLRRNRKSDWSRRLIQENNLSANDLILPIFLTEGINKQIPSKAGLGGGSMNAANILKYFVKKKIIKTTKKEIISISKSISSDVILGLNSAYAILNSRNEIKCFSNLKKFHILIVKAIFGTLGSRWA